jgi:uncharacterized protein (DUF342 family)
MPRKPNPRTRGRSPKDATELDERFLDAAGQNAASQSPEGTHPPERQTFGQSAATWMVVAIDARGQQATLKKLALGGDNTLKTADVIAALHSGYHLVHGIDEQAVAQMLERALGNPDNVLTCNQVVARATLPVPGEDGYIEWSGDLDKEQLQKAAGAQIALQAPSLEEALASNPCGLLVEPGQPLARLHAPTPGTPGCSVFGVESRLPGRPAPLKVGPNVRQSDDLLAADLYGYVGYAGDALSVAAPLWVSGDAMRAVYVHFELLAPAPALSDDALRAAFAARGIAHGIDEQAVQKVIGATLDPARRKHLTLARGSAPVAGVDAHVEYTFDPLKRAGKIMPDGSIDYRERNIVIGVAEGQLLGTVQEATKGQPGYDVFGQPLPTTDGKDHVFKAGENVRAEGDPPKQFYAQSEGNAHVAGDTLHVKPVYVVSGDVDYGTGNINTPIDVQINGSVRAGFKVEAGGSIVISGAVESGVTLVAQGDIIVSQGIVGDGTTVAARGLLSMGNVQTKFIQNASVLAKGDIEVGSYIFNSQVRSGGQVVVHSGGGKRGGSIVGGEVFAAQSIQARLCGSATTAGTAIGISPDPVLAIKLAKVERECDVLEDTLERLLHLLGLANIDVQRLKSILRQAPNARKAQLAERIDKLYKTAEAREKAHAEKETLSGQHEATLAEAFIAIEGTLFAGVAVKIGKELWVADAELKRSRIFIGEDGIEHQPL